MARNKKTIAPGRWLDMSGVVARLQKSVNASGGQTAWAAKHEMSVAYVNLVPTNWCDPLLTGPKAVKLPLDQRGVEKLLRGIQDRIRAGAFQ